MTPTVCDLPSLSSAALKLVLLNDAIRDFILTQFFHYATDGQIPQLALAPLVWQNTSESGDLLPSHI